MDVFAQAMADLAASDLGVDAEYRIKGEGPPIPLRLVLEEEDVESRGRVASVKAALVPADAAQIGRPATGDTVTVGDRAWKVSQPAAAWRGWAWRLPLTVIR